MTLTPRQRMKEMRRKKRMRIFRNLIAKHQNLAMTLGIFLVLGSSVALVEIVEYFRLPQSPTVYFDIKELSIDQTLGKIDTTPYAHFMLEFRNEMKKSLGGQVMLDSLSSKGTFNTISNIEKYSSDSTFVFGLVQADGIYHYLNGFHPQFPKAKESSEIRGIASVFGEWIHLLAPRNHLVGDLSDDFLSDIEEVNAEVIGSGSQITAANISRLLGLSWQQNNKAKSDSLTSLIVQAPSSLDSGYQFIGFSRNQSELLANAFNNLYKFVDSNEVSSVYKKTSRSTISVDAILVCSKDTPDWIVEYAWEALSRVRQKGLQDKSIKIYAESAGKTMPINRHIYLIKNSVPRIYKFILTIVSKAVVTILTAFLFLAFILVWLYRSITAILKENLDFREAATKGFRAFQPYWKNVLRVIVVIFIITTLIWATEVHFAKESALNQEFINQGPLAAISWVTQYLLTDIPKYKLSSQVSYFWLGLLQVGWLALGALGIQFVRDKIIKQVRSMSNHVVIIGYSKSTSTIIKEIFDDDPSTVIKIIGHKKYKFRSDMASVAFDLDSVPEREIFKHLNLEDSQSIIILPDKKWAKRDGYKEVDLWILNMISRIKKFLVKINEGKNQKNKIQGIQIIVEVEDQKNIDLIRASYSNIEAVCISNFGRELIAQTVKRPNILKVYRELLDVDKGNNEINYVRLSDRMISLKLKYSLYKKAIDENFEMTAVGYIDESGVQLNPIQDMTLDKPDSVIIVMSRTFPDTSKIFKRVSEIITIQD